MRSAAILVGGGDTALNVEDYINVRGHIRYKGEDHARIAEKINE